MLKVHCSHALLCLILAFTTGAVPCESATSQRGRHFWCVWRFAAGGPIFSSPCVSAAEQEIFFGSHDCFIYCCSKEGHLRWKFETTARVYATPFAFSNHPRSDDALLAAASTDGKLWVLESRSGELRSVYELPGEVFSSPVVWESMLVIGCRNNYIYCLDLLCGDKNNQV